MYFLIEFEPLCQKLWAFLSNFGFLRCPFPKYGQFKWPKIQISKNFYFVQILYVIPTAHTIEKPF